MDLPIDSMVIFRGDAKLPEGISNYQPVVMLDVDILNAEQHIIIILISTTTAVTVMIMTFMIIP